MTYNKDLIVFWIMNSKLYDTLKYIIDQPDSRDEHTRAVLQHMPYVTGTSFISSRSGTDYDLYRRIIGSAPQPVPELKLFPKPIAEALSIHPCWVGWAGIFDRTLTSKERHALVYYRTAFLVLLANGLEQEAYSVMSLAQDPLTGKQITPDLIYSKPVLNTYLKNEVHI